MQHVISLKAKSEVYKGKGEWDTERGINWVFSVACVGWWSCGIWIITTDALRVSCLQWLSLVRVLIASAQIFWRKNMRHVYVSSSSDDSDSETLLKTENFSVLASIALSFMLASGFRSLKMKTRGDLANFFPCLLQLPQQKNAYYWT